MELWKTREQALAALRDELRQQAELVEAAFIHVDECINRLRAVTSPFGRVCGLTLAKGRNLALGVYSLTLDGLAQEAGALLRPLIETVELLIYFRLDPARVEEAIQGKLPSAGQIAKKIEGRYKDLRQYLSEHASHFGFTYDSLKHIADPGNNTWATSQPYSEAVLRTNLGALFFFGMHLATEGFNCVSAGHTALDDELADRIESLRDRGLAVFREHQGVESQ